MRIGVMDEDEKISFTDTKMSEFFAELDRREKEEVGRLRDLIKEAQKIEETLQAQYVRLTGCRCF